MGKKGELDENQLRSLHRECLTLLFKGIRFYEIQSNEDERYRQVSPTPQEILFLNNLHSSQKERLDSWWLKASKHWRF